MKRLALALALWLILGTAAATAQVSVGVSIGVVVPRWPGARIVVIDREGYRYHRYDRYRHYHGYRYSAPTRVVIVRHWPRRRYHRW